MALVTTSIWPVRPDHEDAVFEAWTRFTKDAEAARSWKADQEFGERMGRVQQHVDGLPPSELELVAAVAATPNPA